MHTNFSSFLNEIRNHTPLLFAIAHHFRKSQLHADVLI